MSVFQEYLNNRQAQESTAFELIAVLGALAANQVNILFFW